MKVKPHLWATTEIPHETKVGLTTSRLGQLAPTSPLLHIPFAITRCLRAKISGVPSDETSSSRGPVCGRPWWRDILHFWRTSLQPSRVRRSTTAFGDLWGTSLFTEISNLQSLAFHIESMSSSGCRISQFRRFKLLNPYVFTRNVYSMASNEAVLVENAVSKQHYLQFITIGISAFLDEHVQFHLKPSYSPISESNRNGCLPSQQNYTVIFFIIS